MFQIDIAWHELRTLAKTNPEMVKGLSKVDKQIDLEGLLADKGYYDFKYWVNSLDDLPMSYFEHVTIKPLPSLRVETDGSMRTIDIKEAVKLNQVHLPGNELLSLREIKVESDICTDQVNEDLKEGWKIIAVLPQVKQRRPDYILGRY